MSVSPKTYRVYCYDGAQGVVSADFLEANSDEEAIAMAQERGFGSKCELWDGKRLIAQLSEEGRLTA